MAAVVDFSEFARARDLDAAGRFGPTVPRTSIIVPAYNEEAGLDAVLKKLFSVIDHQYEVLVIDDGSEDSTSEVATRYPCILIRHEHNLGKGAALQTGIEVARADRVIFIDADDSYPVEEVPSLAEKLAHFDVVFGERQNGRNNIPFLNRLGNWFIGGMLKILYGFKGGDPLTGFYGIGKQHLQDMQLRSSGFSIEAEIALKAARMGLTVERLPILYQERVGSSKLRAARDGYQIFQTILGLLTMYSPTMVFLIPGALLFLVSSLAFAVLIVTPITVGTLVLGTNSLLAMGMVSLAGFQFATLGVALHLYGLLHKHTMGDRIGMASLRLMTSPASLIAGGTSLVVAITVSLVNFATWTGAGFGAFTATNSLFLGAYLGVWGLQLLLSAMFLSALVGDSKQRADRQHVRLVPDPPSPPSPKGPDWHDLPRAA